MCDCNKCTERQSEDDATDAVSTGIERLIANVTAELLIADLSLRLERALSASAAPGSEAGEHAMDAALAVLWTVIDAKTVPVGDDRYANMRLFREHDPERYGECEKSGDLDAGLDDWLRNTRESNFFILVDELLSLIPEDQRQPSDRAAAVFLINYALDSRD